MIEIRTILLRCGRDKSKQAEYLSIDGGEVVDTAQRITHDRISGLDGHRISFSHRRPFLPLADLRGP